jgi:hypothetical protein
MKLAGPVAHDPSHFVSMAPHLMKIKVKRRCLRVLFFSENDIRWVVALTSGS